MEISPHELTKNQVNSKIAGIILAGGEAKRYGSPKQLLLWRGSPFVRCVANAALSAGLDPVVLVTGANAEQVSEAVKDLPLHVAYNPDWQDGQSTSLRRGIVSLPDDVQAALIFLVDMPQISQELIHALITRYQQTRGPIVTPRMGSRRGNPVLFDRAVFHDLTAIKGDEGGRVIFQRYPVQEVLWEDALLLMDVDTNDDYLRLIEMDNQASTRRGT